MARRHWRERDHARLLPVLGVWLILSVCVALLAAAASAAFMAMLTWATDLREHSPWWLLGLPPAGFAMVWIYQRYGLGAEKGNNLLLDEIHDPRHPVPLRMVPLVLVSTLLTHLVGGSAGREGTAVQMGGALADWLARTGRVSRETRRQLLVAGMAAGFAALFGTPLAAAVFALEVLAIGRIQYDTLLPVFLSAVLAARFATLMGIAHSHYSVGIVPDPELAGLLTALALGAAAGIAAWGFSRAMHGTARAARRWIPHAPSRAAAGGLLIAVLIPLTGAWRYAGLGLPVIADAFRVPLPWYDPLAKLGLTALTLGSGFKGGEVTPLFFIGASLGNVLAPLGALPMPLMAGVGMVAVFAGAANTPLAGALMAMELFGAPAGGYAAVACVMSYCFAGHSGIYLAQRIAQGKFMAVLPGTRLGDERALWRARLRSRK
ncbi:chloride channel protein [Paludibacterium paludis]|uniref:chloride channel protein n=1 Tax=Paludibacterium paludis TaxID=1225769 RepID=UPI001FD3A2AF|nr:chloride channel protein [Paludibacterium paludis]